MSLTVTDHPPTAPAPDPVLAAAVDLARQAAVEDAGADQVGEHLDCAGVESGDAPVVAHLFGCTSRAYVGWTWSVALTRLADSDRVTVDEVVLQPGDGALLPPPWVPWSERLQAGDLGVGDLLPTSAEDERLVPAYVDSGDPAVEEVAVEFGLGRVRVMSRFGRSDAAQRWREGPTGPHSPLARQAPGECGTCGFYLPLAGSLRGLLGACGNEYSPSDGMVVAVEHGCGAHSEAVEEPEPEPLTDVSYDTAHYDVLDAEIEPVRLGAEIDPVTGDAPDED
ncbi:hypothetical protein BH20ACT5_BH20ACT5_09400 [soil metagenome]